MTPLNTALHWKQQGIATVPLYYRSKMPHSRALIRSGLVYNDGRATWTPLKSRPATEQQIRQWFRSGKNYNLALVTTDHLAVLDFDDPHQYGYWFAWMLEINPSILETYTVISARGIHLYYWIQKPFEPIKTGEPYEIKSHGKLITIPPSVHPSGVAYRAIYRPIVTVETIQDILTFEPVKLQRPVLSADPWTVREYQPYECIDNVEILNYFPEARETSEGYYLCNCPIHGRHANFMLNIRDRVAYCYAGCGTFLFSELKELLG